MEDTATSAREGRPGESRCLYLFEAPDAEVTREVNDAAAFIYTRILNALDIVPDEGGRP